MKYKYVCAKDETPMQQTVHDKEPQRSLGTFRCPKCRGTKSKREKT
jgi:predicted SprT family Zn-dependent metalloprotease